MTKFRELPATIVGQLGEQIVAREYRRDGWGVIASYKFSGANDNEAPAIEIEEGGREITPDLDVSKGGKRIWIEVKTHAIAKRNDNLSREQGRDVHVHGVPVRLFNNYLAVEGRSGNPVFLAIVQLDTREILVSPRPISQMFKVGCMCGGCRAKRACTAGPAGRYPQWYWDKDEFEVLGHVDERTFKVLDEKHRAFKRSHTIRRHVDNEPAPRDRLTTAKPPWTWACLVCNGTGTDDGEGHRCQSSNAIAECSRTYWRYRLRWVLPNATDEEIAALVAKPIARTRIAELLGPSWLPSGGV